MKPAYILPLCILFSILACKKPVETQIDSIWTEYKNPVLSHTSLRDTIPSKFLAHVDIKEIQSVKATYSSGKHTSYFEYDANAEEILNMISSLPFKRCNAISDTTCRKFDIPFSQTGKRLLSRYELFASKFFWEINPQEFLYYECLKNPARHTILINRKTGRILHRVESVS